MKKLIVLVFMAAFASLIAVAHQPRIVGEEDIHVIENPEVSQAFYGSMEGSPEYFSIVSEKPFSLYISILVPDVEGIGKDVSVDVLKDEDLLFTIDGTSHEWPYYYEEHAGDGYYQGPELKSDGKEGHPKGIGVDAGTYTLKVYSPDNEGKYVLVVGSEESFPVKEIINAIVLIPKLKRDFFDKSPFGALKSRFVLYVTVPFALIMLAVLASFFMIRKKMKGKKRSKAKHNPLIG